MELRFVKLITTLVEEGSLSKAARKLHLTPSALSHQLKDFENQSGTLFFIRANRRLNITSAGKMVYESAKSILLEVDKLELQLKNLNTSNIGSFRVCSACTTGYHWLPGVLKEFSKEYPNVQVDIQLDISGDPITEILRGNLEVAIVNTMSENHWVEYTYLFEDEMVAVVSNDHPWSGKPYVIARDFREEHLIIHSRPLDTVVVYSQVLKPKGIEPRKISELPLTEATIELIRAGLGVAVMARWAVRPYLESGWVQAVKINRKGLYRKHYAALRKGDRAEYVKEFIRCLSERILL